MVTAPDIPGHRVGAGGFATVYRCWQLAVGREAAATGPAGTGPHSQAGAADAFGIPTKSVGCPAATLRVARARCPASPECFGGITIISGDARAEAVRCDRPHYW